jgi:hypothetical protein
VVLEEMLPLEITLWPLRATIAASLSILGITLLGRTIFLRSVAFRLAFQASSIPFSSKLIRAQSNPRCESMMTEETDRSPSLMGTRKSPLEEVLSASSKRT